MIAGILAVLYANSCESLLSNFHLHCLSTSSSSPALPLRPPSLDGIEVNQKKKLQTATHKREGKMDEEQQKPAAPPSEQVIEAKKKIGEAFSVFDREGKNVCDVREVGTIIRSLNVYPTEKQLQRWIHEIEEEEPTGFIVYEKVNIVSCTMRCASAYRL